MPGMTKKDQGISLPHAHVRGMAKATNEQRKKKHKKKSGKK